VPNLALIALGDSHHSQGGMKFATQISPLLNFIVKIATYPDKGQKGLFIKTGTCLSTKNVPFSTKYI
jgi:hypothetical protein